MKLILDLMFDDLKIKNYKVQKKINLFSYYIKSFEHTRVFLHV